MAISRVTSQDASNTSGTTSVTATYPATPTQNDLLVGWFYANVASANFTLPSGWSQASISTFSSNTAGALIAYKVAGAGESTSVLFSATGASVCHAVIAEYQGNATSSVLDKTNTANGTNATSLATGTTATTTQADELAVYLVATVGNVTSPTWDSPAVAITATARLLTAQQILSATGAITGTARWTTGRNATGHTATFKAAAAVAGSPLSLVSQVTSFF